MRQTTDTTHAYYTRAARRLLYRRVVILTLVVVCAASMKTVGRANGPSPIYRFTPSGSESVKIDIDCARRAAQPLNRLLLGKFCEHLGRNIYHGMWAQLVHNPGFATAKWWGRSRAEITRFLAQRGGLAGQADWVHAGLPPYWAAFVAEEPGRMHCSAVTDLLPGRPCLRIEHRGGGTSPAGIYQVLDLPITRQQIYDFSLRASVSRDTILNVRLASQTNAQVASQRTLPVRTGGWRQLSTRFRLSAADSATASRFRLEITVPEPVTVTLDQCLLFPADNRDGWDPEVVRLTRESRLPVLRWPGGNFVSGYHWKDGIGPPEKRPMRVNRPWHMPEPNYVGTDEFMRFCELAGCAPMICVNAGNGTPEEAADWVEYCNGAVTTPMGKLRAANGHAKPYSVRYWEIGNELYGTWQIGHCTAAEYAQRYRAFVNAMRRRDPTIRFIANGHDLHWNQTLIDNCGDILQRVSVHTLIGGRMPTDTPPEEVWWSVVGYPWKGRQLLRRSSDQLRARVPDGTLAITELQIFTNRPNLPNNSNLAEALFWAGTMMAAVRAQPRVELITHSAMLNHGGGLRKQREVVYPNPVYLARKLYSTQPGRWPVAVHVAGPAFSTPRLHNLPPITEAPVIDALALTTDSCDELVLLLINRDANNERTCAISVSGFKPSRFARWQWITGPTILAANSRKQPRAVTIQEKTIKVSGSRFAVSVPARCVAALTLVGSEKKK